MLNHFRNLTFALYGVLSSGAVFAQSMTIDSAFGNQGKYEFAVLGQETEAEAICLQQDGKIVTLIKGDYSTGEVYVIRQLPNGELDATFGQGGLTIIALPDRSCYPREIKMQPDGKIVGALYAEFKNLPSSEIAVFRLLPTGQFDPEFGSWGVVRLGVNGLPTYPADFDLQPDGKIVIASSWEKTGSNSDLAIMRLDSDGDLDPSFGSGGMLLHTFAAKKEFARKIVFYDEHLYVTGDVGNDLGDVLTLFLLKIGKDGTFDSNFGSNGQITYSPPGANYVFMRGIAVLPGGKILVAGDYGYFIDNTDFMLLRFNADGKIDNSFGSMGLVHTKVEGDFNFVGSMLVQPDGKIILAGTTQYNCWCAIGGVARFLADGQLDTTFGQGGKMIIDFGDFGDFNDAALDSDGSILLTGNTHKWSPDLEYTAVTCRLKNNLPVSTTDHLLSPIKIAKITPNPIRQNTTTCHLALDKPSYVVITLTNGLGHAIAPVFNDELQAGMHQIPVSLDDGLPNGVYFLEVWAGDRRQVLQLLKM